MAIRYSNALLTSLMGSDPLEWEFRGQCYDAGVDSVTECAITKRRINLCYIIHRTGPVRGKVTIGAEAFGYVSRFNEKLAADLEKGRAFLLLHSRAIRKDATARANAKRRQQAQVKWRKLIDLALRRVDTMKQHMGTGTVPECFMDLGQVAGRTVPPLKIEYNLARWYEGQIGQLEILLAETLPLVPVKGRRSVLTKIVEIASVSVPEPVAVVIPEPQPVVVLNGIDDVEFEDIFEGNSFSPREN